MRGKILHVGRARMTGGSTNPTRHASRCRRSAVERLEDRVCLNGEPAITLATITPQVVEGSPATLDVSFADSRPVDHTVTVKWGDGKLDYLSLPSGASSFQLTHVFQDGDAPGSPQNAKAVEVTVDAGSLIRGTDVVFILDVSGSTSDTFGGSPVGDLNGDGDPDSILDAQIAGYLAMTQSLIDKGLGNDARVAIVAFSSDAYSLDMDPNAGGTQIFTTPLADTDADGQRDLEEALRSATYGGVTNYEAAFNLASYSLGAMGTPDGMGNVIFLSDGYPNTGGDYMVPVNALKAHGHNVRAFGVGTGSSLSDLSKIDPLAIQFTTTDELTNVLSGGGSVGGGTDTVVLQTTVLNAPPVVEAGPDGTMNVGEAVDLTAKVTDVGVLDTVSCSWAVTNSAGQVVAQGTGMTAHFQPVSAGVYTVTMAATDDDGGVGSDTCTLTVASVMQVGPRVIDARACGLRGNQFSNIVVTFDAPLDKASATRASNYWLIAPGRDGRLGTRDDAVVPMAAAHYDPAHSMVVLTTAVRPCLYRNYVLVALGSAPIGIRGLDGTLLDGSGQGRPGTDYRGLLVPHAVPAQPAVKPRVVVPRVTRFPVVARRR